MRIQRHTSRLSFRHPRRRRMGCVSFTFMIGVLVGLGVISWTWLERRLNLTSDANQAASTLNVSDYMRAAREAFALGDLDAVVRAAREALSLNPVAPDAIMMATRALVYRSYTDYDRAVDRQSALQIARDAARAAPDDADIQAAYAFALNAAGQPVEAARIAERILDDKPDHTLARTTVSLAYGSVGSFEIALRESILAVQNNDPDMTIDALRALALAHSDRGSYAEAGRAVEAALRLNDHLPVLYFEQALFNLQLGNTDAATVAYFQVLAIDPDNVKARLRLCEVSSLLREHSAAISYCDQVTTLAPAWSEGWYRLGREYFLAGNFEAAQENLHRCSSLQIMQNVPVSERRFECWYLQGQAAEIRGDCEALVQTYNEYREMVVTAQIEGSWTYPPEGPPCRGVGSP